MKISGIYKIQSICKPDRFYIGSAVNIHNRWIRHHKDLRARCHHSKKLQRHYDKYGEADLQFSVLLGCPKEDLIKTEQYFLDSYKPYFNGCMTAGSTLGMKLSEEAKRKLSKVHKGKKMSEEAKVKLGLRSRGNKNMLGKHHSEETKQKMSVNRTKYYTGKHQSEETKKKLSIVNTGKHHSEETKQKMSDAKKGKPTWNKGLKNPEGITGKIRKLRAA